jgi:hypothetical protein
MQVIQIAQICHEANRAYCAQLGDDSQVPWDEAPEWQKDSAINGVQFHMDNPFANPIDSHANWMAEKEQAGWKWGPEKDEDLKLHPCFKHYHELPIEQRIKDQLFINVVRAITKVD